MSFNGNYLPVADGDERRSTRSPLTIGLFFLLGTLLVVFVVLYAVTQSRYDDVKHANQAPPDPNVIFFIADGYSPSSATFIRTMLNSTQLPTDELLVGMVRTLSASSLITESSAAATAYACAKKTYNEAISVLPNMQACGTVMEAAKHSGRFNTGLVTTTRITHATPAAFSSHVADRGQEYDIALQQATQQDIDLYFGGGYRYFINRPDGRNLFAEMEQRGYTTAQTLADFESLTRDDVPLIGLFSNSSHLEFEIDRRRQVPIEQPSLLDMTNKALHLLNGRDKPFFLMIEAGRIDMAEHVNDPAGQYWDAWQYIQSFQAVLDFVKLNPNTIVIATADHATGGFEMGAASPVPYQTLKPYEWLPEVLYPVTASAEFIASQIIAGQAIRDAMAEYTGIDSMTDAEVASIQATIDAGVQSSWVAIAVGQVVSSRAKIGWTTSGHTAQDVNLYHAGRRVNGLTGNLDNTEVASLLIRELGLAGEIDIVNDELEQLYNPETGTTTPSSAAKQAGRVNYWMHD